MCTHNSLRLSSEQNTGCYTLRNMSQSTSDVGSSVSERSPLICNEVIDLTNDTHHLFVMRWDVSKFKQQALKREFVNILNAIVRYGAPDLGLMNVNNPLDFTGYAVYYDRTRVWLVARINEAINRYFDMIVSAAIYQVREDCESLLVFKWHKVSSPVKAAINMFGERVYKKDIPAHESINFERVLRACMYDDDVFLEAPVYMKSFLGDSAITDYFADDYVESSVDSNNIIYVWSMCKRNEWKESNIINSSRKRKAIEL